MKWVTIKRFAQLSGYTEKAIRNKRDRGDWLEERHWVKAPDGRIHVNIAAIQKWIEGMAA